MSDSKAPPATVSLADEEGVRRILVDTVFGLWGLVNNLTRLRPSKLERYRMLRPGFELANARDMSIPRCVKTTDEAIAIMREHHAQGQAARDARS